MRHDIPAHTTVEASQPTRQAPRSRAFLHIPRPTLPWHPGCTICLDGDELATNEHKGVDVAKEDRGFASMDRVRQREIASKGGKAAHQKGTAHEWTSEEARDAGRKGGLASHRQRRERKDSGDTQETQELVGAAAGGSRPEALSSQGK